jgi:hypothetical protein
LGGFRTYNLSLFSDFGEGLIRQSEFRTVEGLEARDTHRFAPWLEAMVGLLYNEDDLHNDDLDHYLSDQPSVLGPFVKVLANDVNIREFDPYAVLHGNIGKHVQYYGGLRGERIQFVNVDKMKPASSFNEWNGFFDPKATIAWSLEAGPLRWLPSTAFSIGQAFFTEDPRTALSPSALATGAKLFSNPLERSHSEQLTFDKLFAGTEARLTLSRTRTTSTLAKIDPDNGSAQDLGPGTIKFFTVNVRHQFSFGNLQGIVSKADSRLNTFDGVPGTITPEAPRTIFDILTTLDKLPLGLHGRAEYEYVGHKLLDVGNAEHTEQYEAVPVGETRIAVVRPFFDGRLELGLNGLIASGYTGQTTETFDSAWNVATSKTSLPYCAAGSGPSQLQADFDCGTIERAVGIRMLSFIGGSMSWRSNSNK